jgi:FMN phosphatase YigB (HAD superfamily)
MRSRRCAICACEAIASGSRAIRQRAESSPRSEITYVSDPLDNDSLPAIDAEMFGVFIPRGPFGREHGTWPERGRASAVVECLEKLRRLSEEVMR